MKQNTFSVRFLMRTERVDKDGYAPISALITINGLQLNLSINRKVNPRQKDFIDKILQSPCHIEIERIATYYYKDRLISAYLLVSKRNMIPLLLKQMQQIEKAIGLPANETETNNLLAFGWADDVVSFSINLDGDSNEVYLYLTLKEYLV